MSVPLTTLGVNTHLGAFPFRYRGLLTAHPRTRAPGHGRYGWCHDQPQAELLNRRYPGGRAAAGRNEPDQLSQRINVVARSGSKVCGSKSRSSHERIGTCSGCRGSANAASRLR
jgi:hypothetical protein